MKLIYMAHAVRGDVAGNLIKAKAWLKHLNEKYEPGHCIIAPWITECEVFDESDEAQRHAGLQRCKRVVEVCDEIWLVGEVGTPGMWTEATHGIIYGTKIVNMTGQGLEECEF